MTHQVNSHQKSSVAAASCKITPRDKAGPHRKCSRHTSLTRPRHNKERQSRRYYQSLFFAAEIIAALSISSYDNRASQRGSLDSPKISIETMFIGGQGSPSAVTSVSIRAASIFASSSEAKSPSPSVTLPSRSKISK